VKLFQMQVLVSLERVCGLLGGEDEGWKKGKATLMSISPNYLTRRSQFDSSKWKIASPTSSMPVQACWGNQLIHQKKNSQLPHKITFKSQEW